ncbi:unnamed protein product [Toxocara canis]|uniref:TOBE domain-containing protein n=1 Tax=Toxocara canis TaxID=6265 RepID=A0A183UAJ5_TOXCA|nr:unnamed protein product [Toxocara canis]
MSALWRAPPVRASIGGGVERSIGVVDRKEVAVLRGGSTFNQVTIESCEGCLLDAHLPD